MDEHATLTFALLALVGILTTLLVLSIVSRRRQTAMLKNLSLSDFADLLRTNSLNGSIQDVAGKVSDLLKRSFGCEIIIFLRRRRRDLELNYYFGLKGLERRLFRLSCSRQLVEHLQRGFVPGALDELKSVLPEDFFSRLRSLNIDVYFPIFWRNNFYGLYLIRSTLATRTAAFDLLVASLAQSLSVAYHIKWHESRYENLHKRAKTSGLSVRGKETDGLRLSPAVLRLVRHRESRALLSGLIRTIKQDLTIEEVAYICHDPKNSKRPMVIQDGVPKSLPVPDGEVFRSILRVLGARGFCGLDELVRADGSLKEWAHAMTDAGLKYAAPFSLSAERQGVLAWSGSHQPSHVTAHLETLRPHANYLVDNADAHERLEEMSYTDNLTGVANRRYFSKRLQEEINRAKRYSRKLALIFFDLDGMKTINDRYGHLAGDAVLRQVGQILRKNVRGIDIVARYGGDEFCIIMPEADATTCAKFMRRLKTKVSTWEFVIDGVSDRIECTISQGASLFPQHAETAEKLVHAADMALLRAKEAGRNNSVLLEPAVHVP